MVTRVYQDLKNFAGFILLFIVLLAISAGIAGVIHNLINTHKGAPVQPEGICIKSQEEIYVYIDSPKLYVLMRTCEGGILKLPYTLKPQGQPANLQHWSF